MGLKDIFKKIISIDDEDEKDKKLVDNPVSNINAGLPTQKKSVEGLAKNRSTRPATDNSTLKASVDTKAGNTSGINPTKIDTKAFQDPTIKGTGNQSLYDKRKWWSVDDDDFKNLEANSVRMSNDTKSSDRGIIDKNKLKASGGYWDSTLENSIDASNVKAEYEKRHPQAVVKKTPTYREALAKASDPFDALGQLGYTAAQKFSEGFGKYSEASKPKIWEVQSNGKAPEQARVGDYVNTKAGVYRIVNKKYDRNGKFVGFETDVDYTSNPIDFATDKNGNRIRTAEGKAYKRADTQSDKPYYTDYIQDKDMYQLDWSFSEWLRRTGKTTKVGDLSNEELADIRAGENAEQNPGLPVRLAKGLGNMLTDTTSEKQKSQTKADTDIINKYKKERNENIAKDSSNIGVTAKLADKGMASELTAEEGMFALAPDSVKQTYNYVYHAHGHDEAKKFMEAYNRQQGSQLQGEKLAEYAQTDAKQSPVLASIGTTAVNTTIPAVAAAINTAKTFVNASGLSDKYYEIDPNTDINMLQKYSDMVRGSISQNLKNDYGEPASLAYNAVMSMADMAASAGLYGRISPKMVTLALSSASGNDAIIQAISSGASQEQALVAGISNGMLEYISESPAVEGLLDIVKLGPEKGAMRILKQMGTEAAGESFAQVSQSLAETIILGNKSGYADAVAGYTSQGYSLEEAQKKAFSDTYVKATVEAAVLGAVTGGVLGGGATAINTLSSGKAIKSDSGMAIDLAYTAKNIGVAGKPAKTAEKILSMDASHIGIVEAAELKRAVTEKYEDLAEEMKSDIYKYVGIDEPNRLANALGRYTGKDPNGYQNKAFEQAFLNKASEINVILNKDNPTKADEQNLEQFGDYLGILLGSNSLSDRLQEQYSELRKELNGATEGYRASALGDDPAVDEQVIVDEPTPTSEAPVSETPTVEVDPNRTKFTKSVAQGSSVVREAENIAVAQNKMNAGDYDIAEIKGKRVVFYKTKDFDTDPEPKVVSRVEVDMSKDTPRVNVYSKGKVKQRILDKSTYVDDSYEGFDVASQRDREQYWKNENGAYAVSSNNEREYKENIDRVNQLHAQSRAEQTPEPQAEEEPQVEEVAEETPSSEDVDDGNESENDRVETEESVEEEEVSAEENTEETEEEPVEEVSEKSSPRKAVTSPERANKILSKLGRYGSHVYAQFREDRLVKGEKNGGSMAKRLAAFYYNEGLNSENADFLYADGSLTASEKSSLPYNARKAIFEAGVNDALTMRTNVRRATNGVSKAEQYKEAAKQISKRQMQEIDALGRMLGVKITFVKKIPGETDKTQGMIFNNKGEMFIRVDGSVLTDPVHFLVTHEAVHRLRTLNPGAYNELEDYIREKIGDAKFRRAINDKSEAYGDMERTELSEEVVANIVARILRSEPLTLDLARENRNLLQKIIDFIQDVIDKIRLWKYAGNTEFLTLTKAEKLALEDLESDMETLLAIYRRGIQDAYAEQYDEESEYGEESVQRSISSMLEAVGIEAKRDEESGDIYYILNGERKEFGDEGINLTVTDLEGTAFFKSIDMANDFLSEDEIRKQKENTTMLINMILHTGDPEDVWNFMGATMFAHISSNADKQYGKTIEFGTICRKTQFVVDVMSQMMIDRKEGLSADDITNIVYHVVRLEDDKIEDMSYEGFKKIVDDPKEYAKAVDIHGTAPCAQCYVFSRWAGIGSILQKMWDGQLIFMSAKHNNLKTLEKLGIEQSDIDRIAKEHPDYFTKDESTGEYVLPSYDEGYISKLSEAINYVVDQARIVPGKDKKAKEPVVKEFIRKYKALPQYADNKTIKIEVADGKTIEVNARDAVKVLENLSWFNAARYPISPQTLKPITITTGKNKGKLEYLWEPVPAHIAFDLNAADVMASQYRASWRYRTTRGSGAGKTAVPYVEAKFGRTLQALATSQSDLKSVPKKSGANYLYKALTRKTAPKRKDPDKKTQLDEQFEKAIRNVFWQNLLGGMRIHSSSDFRLDNALDYVLTFNELQLARSYVQGYTKAPEELAFFASIGVDTNVSLIGRGFGLKTDEKGNYIKDENGKYILDFDPVQGMDISIARYFADFYDNVQTILVGMSDEHIRTALASDLVDQVIPWHSSGNTADRLAKMLGISKNLLEKFKEQLFDYTKVQEDKKVENPTERQKQAYDFRFRLIHGQLTEDKMTAKDKEFLDDIKNSDGVGESILYELYRRFYEEGYDDTTYHAFMPTDQSKLLMPYEYWIKSRDENNKPRTVMPKEGWKISTKGDARECGDRFREYANFLGLVPRFTTNITLEGKDKPSGDFSGEENYWKLLIDRPMYDNNGNYREQQAINMTNVDYSRLRDVSADEKTLYAGGSVERDGKTYQAERPHYVDRVGDTDRAKGKDYNERTKKKATLASRLIDSKGNRVEYTQLSSDVQRSILVNDEILDDAYKFDIEDLIDAFVDEETEKINAEFAKLREQEEMEADINAMLSAVDTNKPESKLAHLVYTGELAEAKRKLDEKIRRENVVVARKDDLYKAYASLDDESREKMRSVKSQMTDDEKLSYRFFNEVPERLDPDGSLAELIERREEAWKVYKKWSDKHNEVFEESSELAKDYRWMLGTIPYSPIRKYENFSMPERATEEAYKYFQDKTNTSAYDDPDEFEYHNLKSYDAGMHPLEYISRCAAMFNTTSKSVSSLASLYNSRAVAEEHILHLMDLMRNGTKMYMPYLVVDNGYRSVDGEPTFIHMSQEGLHRAVAAYNLGIKEIPVRFIYRNEPDVVFEHPELEALEFEELLKPGEYTQLSSDVQRSVITDGGEVKTLTSIIEEAKTPKGKLRTQFTPAQVEETLRSAGVTDDIIEALQLGKFLKGKKVVQKADLIKFTKDYDDLLAKNVEAINEINRTADDIMNATGYAPIRPEQTIHTPQALDPESDERVRRAVDTATNFGGVALESLPGVIDDVLKGSFNYVTTSNEAAINSAKKVIREHGGYDGALAAWNEIVASNKIPTDADMALGQLLIKELSKEGYTERVQKLIGDVAFLGTKLGQATQALNIMKRMGGLPQVTYFRHVIDDYNYTRNTRTGKEGETVIKPRFRKLLDEINALEEEHGLSKKKESFKIARDKKDVLDNILATAEDSKKAEADVTKKKKAHKKAEDAIDAEIEKSGLSAEEKKAVKENLDELGKLNEEKTNLDNQIESAEIASESYKEEIKSLKKELAKKQRRLRTLEENAKKNKEKIQILREQIKELEDRIAETEEIISKITEELAPVRKEVNSFKRKIANANRKLEKLLEKKKELLENLPKLTAEAEAKRKAVEEAEGYAHAVNRLFNSLKRQYTNLVNAMKIYDDRSTEMLDEFVEAFTLPQGPEPAAGELETVSERAEAMMAELEELLKSKDEIPEDFEEWKQSLLDQIRSAEEDYFKAKVDSRVYKDAQNEINRVLKGLNNKALAISRANLDAREEILALIDQFNSATQEELAKPKKETVPAEEQLKAIFDKYNVRYGENSDLYEEARKAIVKNANDLEALIESMREEQNRLKGVEADIRNLKRELSEKGYVQVPEELMHELAMATDPVMVEEIQARMIDAIAEQIKVTWRGNPSEKLNTLRYLAMLGNPRTHIRNMLGNATMLGARNLKDLNGSLLESLYGAAVRTQIANSAEILALPQAERAEAIDRKMSEEFRRTKSVKRISAEDKLAWDEWISTDLEATMSALKGEDKYGIGDKIRNSDKYKTFRHLTFINTASQLNSAALEKEDAIFLSATYKSAMRQYLMANNVSIKDITADNRSEELEAMLLDARTHAIGEAQKATFRDVSIIARGLSRISRANPVGHFMVEALFPFKGVPIKIAERGIFEYSPVGVARATYMLIHNLTTQEGKYTPAQILDMYAAGMTGTEVMLIGMLMHAIGAVHAPDDDDNIKKLEKLMGLQDYSINILGHNYTIDWTAPSSMPFFLGAELHKFFTPDTGDEVEDSVTGAERAVEFVSGVFRAMGTMSAPMLEMSMLSGLNAFIEAIQKSDNGYSNDEAVSATFAMMSTLAFDYIGQFFPTLGGQIVRISRRESPGTHYNRDSALSYQTQIGIQKLLNKVPFLAGAVRAIRSAVGEDKLQTLYEYTGSRYINQWGEATDQGNLVERIFKTMISPGFLATNKSLTDTVDNEILRLYKLYGDDAKNILPGYIADSWEVTDAEGNKTKINLSRDMSETLSMKYGSTAYNTLNMYMKTDMYKNLPDDKKVKAIEMLIKYSTESVASSVVPDYEASGKIYGTIEGNKSEGVSTFETVTWSALNSEDTVDMLDAGTIKDAKEAGMDAAQYGKIISALGVNSEESKSYSTKAQKYMAMYSKVASGVVSKEDFAKVSPFYVGKDEPLTANDQCDGWTRAKVWETAFDKGVTLEMLAQVKKICKSDDTKENVAKAANEVANGNTEIAWWLKKAYKPDANWTSDGKVTGGGRKSTSSGKKTSSKKTTINYAALANS